MIYDADELCILARAYMAGTGVSKTALSIRTAGQTRLFHRLLDNLDCRTQAAERASDWFDSHWPSGVPWPAGVPKRRLIRAA